MRNALILCGCLLLALSGRAADPAPKNLSLEVTVIRFKPDTKERVLQDFNFTGGASAAVESLRAVGKSVDVVYRGTREVALEPKSTAKFDATETRPVVLVGKPGVPAPPATVYGLTLQITARPAGEDGFVLAWEGNLVWSPELMDRRGGLQNTMQFIGKAAAAAQGASQLAGDSSGTVKQAADIGLAVAELFKDKAGDSGIYELPVLKTVALNGSRSGKSGQLIVTTTAAEAGMKEPQMVFFLINPVLNK